MSATPIPLDDLRIFAAVAEASSFSRAAESLGITKGTVSRAIARLESRLGAELLHRTTHRVGLSTAGSALYERSAEHLRALADAVVDLPERDERPSGRLRIAAPHDVGIILLPDIVAAFARLHPAITFDIRLSNDAVDLVADGFDLALRAGPNQLPDSSLIARKLGEGTAKLYAAPKYLACRGTPKTLGDPDHAWIVFRRSRALGAVPDDVEPIAYTDDLFLTRRLVRAGVGIAMLPGFMADAFVVDGTLVELSLRPTDAHVGALYLVYPSSGQTPRKVEAFRDFVLRGLMLGREGDWHWRT